MEGLRISIVLVGSFLAGMSTWLIFAGGYQEHQVAGTACEVCSACDSSFLFSR